MRAREGYRQLKLHASLMALVDLAIERSKGAYRSPTDFVRDATRRRLEDLGILPKRPDRGAR